MGQGGNQLGYGGLSGLAIEFDTLEDSFDPSGNFKANHIGIDVGGSLTSVATRPVPFVLAGDRKVLKDAEIKYDPRTQLLSVHVSTDSETALEPLLTRYLDLCSALKLQSTSVAPTLYVGFTGGSRKAINIGKYNIYNWKVSTGEHSVSAMHLSLCIMSCLQWFNVLSTTLIPQTTFQFFFFKCLQFSFLTLKFC